MVKQGLVGSIILYQREVPFFYESTLIMKSTLIIGCLFIISIEVYGQGERILYFPKKAEYVNRLPKKKNVWIFIMAGQSNMAGRGVVEAQDTLPHPRIITINQAHKFILAKEPLHFYEPELTGLDCGLSFARKLATEIDSSITILLIPAAVGGSSTQQWLGDSLHRKVKLQTNFREKIQFVKKHGIIKGILWHQGESDAEPHLIPGYEERLRKAFAELRSHTGIPKLPIFIGELGSYSKNQENWNLINKAIHRYSSKDKNSFVIHTQDLKPKEDNVHFNSEGQRLMGERFATKAAEIIKR